MSASTAALRETGTGALARLFRRSRPRFWLYLSGPVLVGVAFGAPSAAALTGPAAVGLVAYFLVPANVFLYGVNDLFDTDADRHNPKKDERELRYEGGRLTPVAVAASGLLALPLVLVLPPGALPWLAGFVVLAVAYSVPPVRLKTRPPLDSISNGLYVIPGACAYVALSGAQPPLPVLAGAWLWTMGMHTFSAVPDIEPDRAAGMDTLATALGREQALAYCAGCWLAAAAAFALLDPRAGVLLSVYPALVAAVVLAGVAIDRAYWWFPAINTAVGAVLTLAGLWGVLGG
jgi:4-hydroxybenzoate polyprenyltransferase